MAEYRLSVRVRSQLVDIYEFTTATFGPYQAEAYHAGLERTFGLLADFPRIGQQVDELAVGHRRFRFQSHSIFYTERSDVCPDPRDLSLRPGHQAAAFRLADHGIQACQIWRRNPVLGRR